MKKIRISINIAYEACDDLNGTYLAQKIGNDIMVDHINGRYKNYKIDLIAMDCVLEERSKNPRRRYSTGRKMHKRRK